jgi:hypothetical protein
MTRAPTSIAVALVAAACSKDAPPAQPASAQPLPLASTTASVATGGATPDAAPATAAAAGAKDAGALVPSSPPADCNVVLLSIDSLRADMPWAAYPRAIAPRLTDLEKKAVSYTRAHSMSSYTAMSLGGLLGGRLPSELHRSGYFFGIYKNDLFFPKLLQSAGVHTMGVMAHMYSRAPGSTPVSTTGKSFLESPSTPTPIATSPRPSPRRSQSICSGTPRTSRAGSSSGRTFWIRTISTCTTKESTGAKTPATGTTAR